MGRKARATYDHKMDQHPLVGRDLELQALASRIEATAHGQGNAVLVQGEAGIGKSALLDQARLEVHARGLSLLVGKGKKLEKERPFGPLLDALVSAGATVPGLKEARSLLEGPETIGAGPREGLGSQWRAIEEFTAALENSANQKPLILILEDLHLADHSTLITATHLIRQIDQIPLGLFVSRRIQREAGELDELIDDLLSSGGEVLTLQPLNERDVSVLVEQATPAPQRDVALKYVSRAGGNPLFVRELLDYFLTSQPDDPSELPLDLRSLVKRRLESLDEDALDVLRVASLLGPMFHLADLVTVLGRPATSLLKALDQAMADHLLTSTDDAFVFRHELIRDAIYEEIPAPLRTALHRETGLALAGADAPPLRVASQLALSAIPGDTEAVRWLRAAATAAMQNSPSVAAEILEKAESLAPLGSEERAGIQADLISVLTTLGRGAESREIAQEALAEDLPPELEEHIHLDVARSFYIEGRYEQAADAYRVALGSLGEGSDRTSILTEAAVALASARRLTEAQELIDEAIRLGEEAGDHLAEVRVWRARRLVEDYSYRSGPAGRFAERASDWVQQGALGDDERSHHFFYRGIDLAWQDRHEEALAMLRKGRRFAEESGRIWHLPRFQAALGQALFEFGQWDDALTEFETGVALSDEVESRWSNIELYGTLAMILAFRGNLPEARATLDAGERRSQGSDRGSEWLLPIRILVTHLERDVKRCIGLIEVLERSMDDDVVAGFNEVFSPDLVRALKASGRQDYAERIVVAVEELAQHAEITSFRGTALRCRGLLSDDPELLLVAAECYPSGRPFQWALTKEDLAFALSRHGRKEEALASASEALDVFLQLNATLAESRLRANLLETGTKLGPRREERPRFGWDSLTPSELRIVELVKEGMSNPEIAQALFISRYTVATHLRHVFEKLGVSSRALLAAEAARRTSASEGVSAQE